MPILAVAALAALLALAPAAHAYTFPSGLTSANATTASGVRCSGTYVGSLGGSGGTGSSPSWASLAWAYLSAGSLPAGYNSGTYCIDAELTVEDDEDGGGRPGGGEGGEGESNMIFETYGAKILSFLAEPVLAASWNVSYSLYSGAGTTPAPGRYALTYAASGAAPTASLTASPTSITAGGSSVLTWSSTNAASCTGTGFSTGGATSGSVSVSPASSASYSLACTGTGGTANASANVTVSAPPACHPGGTVVGYRPWGTSDIVLEDDFDNQYNCCAGSVLHGGPYLNGNGGTDVVCRPDRGGLGIVRAELAATPESIASGESSTLTWSSLGAEVCVGSGFSSGNGTSGSLSVSPSETTTYFLTCYADAQAASGGSGANVPFVMEEWWTGGGSELVWGETVHNNDFSEQQRAEGYGFEEMCAAAASGYDAWNMVIRDTERTGDAGTHLAYIQCYGVNNPTGTRSRPQEQHITHHAWQPTGGVEYTTYLRSESANGTPTNAFAVALATVDVGGIELSAGGVSPIFATEGEPTALSAIVTNAGSATTAVPFPNLWQIDDDANHASVYGTYVDTRGPLAGGGTLATQRTQTFPSAGTWYARACADNDASFASAVVEANEDNNCGPWTAIQVEEDTEGEPATCSLSTNPSPLAGGVPTTFTWSSTNATSCSGSGFATGGATSGTSGTVTPVAGVTYQLQCTPLAGGAPCTRQLVASGPAAEITAAPDRVNSGGLSAITWTTSQCTSVSVTKNGAVFSSDPSGTGVSSGPITVQTTFRVSCDGGAASDSVIVNIVPAYEEF